MPIIVKCKLCGEIITVTGDSTASLIEHLKIAHPNITLDDLELYILNQESRTNNSPIDSRTEMPEMLEKEKDKNAPKKEKVEQTTEPKRKSSLLKSKRPSNDEQLKTIPSPTSSPTPLLPSSSEQSLKDNAEKSAEICKCQSEEHLKAGRRSVDRQGRDSLVCECTSLESLKNRKYSYNSERMKPAIIEEKRSSNDSSLDKNKNDKNHVKGKSSTEIFVGVNFKPPLINWKGRENKAEPNQKESRESYTRRYRYKSAQKSEPSERTVLYKTSVAAWRPGKGTVFCPKCGANKVPVVKVETDKVSYSPLGAACILTCWPFCFLPCLFPPPSKEYLYCVQCNHFLGIYDRKADAITENEDVDLSKEHKGKSGRTSTTEKEKQKKKSKTKNETTTQE